MKSKCQNLCVSCRNRGVVEYRHIIDITYHKHNWFAQLWYDFKDACRWFVHKCRYSGKISDIIIERNNFFETQHTKRYHFTYQPFNVCNKNKRVESLPEFNQSRWITYHRMKSIFELKKHSECDCYKNKGAMAPKKFKLKYTTFIDN